MARLTQILFMLCLCSVGFCCNKGWFFFEGKCYTKSQQMYDFLMAKRYCQMSQARLARVTSVEMLQYLSNIPTIDAMHEYWVAEDSSVEHSTESQQNSTVSHSHEEDQTTTSHSSLCQYMKISELKLEYCIEKKFFICETESPEVSPACQPDFDFYGSHCYRAITQPSSNFNDSFRVCLSQNSILAILDTEEKEWEAKAAIIGKNATFFVSAQKTDDGIKWTNGENFSPVDDVFANYSDGSCISFVSEPARPLIFSWVHTLCNESQAFLCQSDPLPPKEIETTTTTPSTTTQMSLECPHGYNWKSHEDDGYCFWETTYETERLNWFQARRFCQLYGGDLASYDDEKQETIGLGGARGHYRGLWIGLKRDENNVFHWVDGSLLNFTNWAFDEPNLQSNSKFCVIHTSGASKWGLDYCGVRRWFVCKAPKARNPVMPDMPAEEKPQCDINSGFGYRWYKYENNCYLIRESNKYTWDTARIFCQDNGGHMISIHSFEETDHILSSTSGYHDSNFWIGLSTQGPDTPFEWSDHSPLDFLYWSDARSEVKDFHTCVTFNKRDGSWDVDHCNRLQGVICKRGVNASLDFTSTDEPTTVMPGNCDNGWYNLGNKCYKIFGALWSQRLSWPQAKLECSSMGASLVSIHGKDEQEFLTDLVLEGYADVWIGLRSIERGTIFHWSDDSRMDYTNWNSNEPNGYHGDVQLMGTFGNEICVEMEYSEKAMGKWNEIRCSEKKAFMCQKLKDPSNTEYIDPFTCPNITGWSRLGSTCYGFFEQYNMTWLDAQRECRKYSANLISYKNAAVSIFVKRKLKLKNAFFWTGVREKMEGTYEHVAGQALFYTNWMVNQPQAASSFMDNCVATTAEGEWLVKSCKERHPFICQSGLEIMPEFKVDRSHSCLNVSRDWQDFGGSNCYMIETDMKMNWVGSMYYCLRHGGYLASFHSIGEVDKLLKNFHSNYGSHEANMAVTLSSVFYQSNDASKSSMLHIGLMRKKDGSIQWVDKGPVDFVNWDESELDLDANSKECLELPEGSSHCKECVEMSMNTGKWSYINCNDHYLGFICSSPKVRLSNFEDQSAHDELKGTSERSDTEKKLIVGGIFGFLLCILVILAIIGLIFYYLKYKKEVRPTLLEQDNL